MLQQVLERMRLAREEQGLDLEALARKTRIRVHQLEAVERGRFEQLPRGVYARAVVRAYAEAVGLEPNNAVAQIAPLLPEPEDAMAGIARVHGYDPPARTRPVEAPPPPSGVQGEPAPLPDAPRARWTLDPTLLARASAAAIDGGILAAITGLLVAASAGAAELSVAELLAFAAPAMAMLVALIAALYFLLLGGIAGATIGHRVARLAPVRTSPSLDLSKVCRRGAAAAARELSIIVDLALPAMTAWRSTGIRTAVRSETPWEGTAPVP
jgi:hypothetical protein